MLGRLVPLAVLAFALVAFTTAGRGAAANPKLIATVGTGDAFVISLTDTGGNPVTSLPVGTYDIEVHDNSAIHNFDLIRPNSTSADATTVGGTGTVTWTVNLTQGTWTFQCDAHPSMNGSFAVTAPTPSAANDAYATDEDTPLNQAAPGVLANDTDPNG